MAGAVKQRFETKALKKIKRTNAFVFLVVFAGLVAVCAIYTFVAIGKTPVENEAMKHSPELFRMAFLLVFAYAELWFIPFSPIASIYLGIQSGRKKRLVESATFNKTLGIDYYRDLLAGVSPAMISIVMDLKIEDEKDVSATLLRLYRKNAISFEGDRIVIVPGSTADIGDDEREILDLLKFHKLDRESVTRWKNNRFQEAVVEGYISNRNAKKESKIAKKIGCAPGCMTGCFSWVVAFAALVAFGDLFVERFNSLTINSPEFVEMQARMAINPTLAEGDLAIMLGFVVFAVTFLIIVDLVVMFPCFVLFRTNAYQAGPKIVRTPKGDKLAEKVAGLKHFIHEFSTLSEAEKEHVILWDDFLVYAVVLEENSDIVKDISRLSEKSVSDLTLDNLYGILNQ